MQRQTPRRTKIVATLGPATSSLEAVAALAQAGMDAARAAIPRIREAIVAWQAKRAPRG